MNRLKNFLAVIGAISLIALIVFFVIMYMGFSAFDHAGG